MLQFMRKVFTRKRMMILFVVCTMSVMLAVGVSAETGTGGTGGTAGNALTNLTTAIAFIWEQFTKMADIVTSQPILLIPVAVFCAGVAIGLVKRLIN